MHRKFDLRRYLTAFFIGIFAVMGSIVAIDAPANAANDLGYNSTVDYSMKLTASNSQYATTSATNVIPGTGSFTTEVWVKENSGISTCADVIGQGILGSATGRFLIRIDGTTSTRALGIFQKHPTTDTSLQIADAYLAQDSWNHIAVSFTSGTGYSVYLNGSLVVTIANTSTTDQAGPFWVGRNYHSSGCFFDGNIDEVKVWSTARTETQIKNDMHVYGSDNTTTFDSNLRAYYDMNEGSGTTFFNRTATSGLNLTASSSAPGFEDAKSQTKINGKTIVTFKKSYLTPVGGWTVPSGLSRANVLVVGGGGAGGSGNDNTGGGGGGAGGFTETFVSLTSGAIQTVKVGQGGRPDLRLTIKRDSDGTTGQGSTFGTTEVLGGGGGAGRGSRTGLLGASSGGSTGVAVATAGTSPQGNAGGAGGGGTRGGGGGGGAASAGSAGSASYPGNGGAGGTGKTSEINSVTYSAGGAGGSSGITNTTGTGRASANSGNGGAGGSATNNTAPGEGGGSFGGSGIVVIAYAPTDDNYLSFNGTTQYANLNGAQAIPASSGFTVEAWVNPAASGAGVTAVIVSQGTGLNRFYMKRYNGYLYTYRDQQQGLTGTEMNCGALTADKWSHVAIAMDGTNTYCYINGQSTKTIAFAYGTKTVGANLFVGQYSAGGGSGDQWKGGIDQVKIWNTAITDPALIERSMRAYQDQDSTGYISGSSGSRTLTAHYDFNESASSTSVEDKVGSATLGTTGSPTRTSIVSSSSSGAKTIYTFVRTVLSAWGGWFSPTTSGANQALIVGAGGGGGKSGNPQNLSAGSGAGGAVYPISSITLPTSPITVVVGQAGNGSTSDTGTGDPGGFSQFGTLKVAGGGGGNSFQYTGVTPAGPGGSDFVAAGNGGGARQDVGASTQSYALGGAAGTSANQTFNGNTFTALAGVVGGGDYSGDNGSGGLGGMSVVRTSSISGSSVEYGKQGLFAPWDPALKTYGSGGTSNYGYGTGTVNDPGEAGASGVVIVSVKTAYTVTFDANGGSGSLTSQNINIGSSANLTANSGSITKSGYTFAGWATSSGGTVSYGDGVSITPSADVTLYAQWLSNSSITGNQYVGQVLTAASLTTPTPGGAATSYTYQWQSALTSGGTYTNISGATSSTFTITCAEVGKYIRVIVVGVYSGNISSGNVVSTPVGKIAASSSSVVTNDNLLIYLDAGNSCSSSTSGKWTDLSGNGNDATLAGATGTPTLTSSAGGYFAYNRANAQYADVGTKTFDFSAGLTLSFWANFTGPASSGNWERIIDFGNGAASDNIDVGRKNATNELFIEIFRGSTSQGYCETSTSGSAIADGVWAHYSITVDSSRVCKIYKNGSALTLSGNATSFTFSGLPATVSRANNYVSKSNWTGDAAFGGGLADLALYNTGLSGSQVTSNYTAQRYIAVATPTFSSHPANVTKSAGETATFSVSASTSDAGTLSYQWEVSANNGSTWMNVSGGTGATTNSYTTPTLVSADLGKQYRVVVTNTLTGATATATSNAATLTIGLDKINVNFDELNFDFANVTHIVGTNGKSQGNKVLFLNVTTKNGVQVDALVTTETLTNATITNYETGARAGGANSYFQTDVDFSQANGFAQFKFDFYKHGVAGSAGDPCTTANTTCSGATKVVIQNVNVSAIDIDYYQWNDFTQAESYSLAGNTKLKECAIPSSGTCTTRTAPSTFPADMRFQGSPDTARTNDPVDMAIVTYADIETFRIKFGRDRAGSPNYYGVAFKALDWGTTTPQTTGGTNYTISYNENGASTGSQSGTHVGAAGSLFTVLSAGTAVKTGHTFSGWATTANATTATYTGSSKVTMPGSNLTLYAVWTPIKYTLTYNVNGGTGAPAAGSFETGTNNVTLSSTVPTRTGFVFGGWDTVVNSGSGNVNYASGASYSMPASNVTLYAKWTAANGTLTYNANGGSTTQADVTAAGGSTTTVANGSSTSRTGYDFVGWNSKADGTGTSYAVGSTVTLSANTTTTIYAQWTLSKYTLVFNVNGGVGTPQSQSYVQGATTTMPVSNPTRAGYNFAGWNSQADGNGTAYNGSFLMPGNNLTLYAKWTAITYNVIYNNNSATYSGATGTVTDATNYTAAQSVTVAAGTGLSNVTNGTTYRFIGWNTNAAGTGTDYLVGATFAMPAGNTTLYAMWLDSSVEIAYNANGGSGAPANDNAVINTRYDIQTAEPTKTGYTFGGWKVQDTSPAGTYKVGGTEYFSPDSNYETLVAQWTAVNYTVTFDTDGGSTAPSQQTNKNIGNTISISSTPPTKTGYTFLGWKDADGNIYPAGGSFSMGAGNVTLTAQWQGNAYTLTYDANGGSGAPAAESRNYTASANLSATQPTRTGYTFQGWNTLVGGGGTAYNASASYTMPNSNATLFAQWTANSYVLAYNTQGGSTAPSSSNKSFNATVTVSGSTPTRTGFTFAGWNTVAAGTGTTYLPSATFSMPDANVTLYAQWTKTAFTLYYNTNGGQGVFSSQPVKYGESVTVDSTAPTKTGYTFTGWNTAADGSGFDHTPRGVFTLNVESNVTLFAKWTAVSYTVTYSANTGSGAPTGGSHNFGATVTTAAKGSMALSGYRFIGWNDRADGTGTTYLESSTFSMPAENVILYAQWIDALFEIAYNANGGAGGPDGADVPDGTSYTVDPIQPVRPGYTFSGWKLADGTPTTSTYKAGTATQTFTISGNEVLVAQWTIKTITVTYDLNGGGGTTPSAGSGNFNSNITLASSSGVTRSNFEFVGWSTTPDGTGTTYVDGSSFKLPADDVILYAKWAPIYYIIEYNAAGGSGAPADQFATPSSTVAIASQEPTKPGYEFDKWTEVSQGTDFTPGASLTMPSSNVVLVANYTVRAAGVPGSGSGSNTGVIDPGTKPISKPKELVLSVYFKGDSPVLTDRAKLHLRKLAATAKSYGRANNITIYGRVKETNDKSYDLRLSKARAANVAAYLKKYGVTGAFKVYAKGISPENTYKSRRVDMKLWWAK